MDSNLICRKLVILYCAANSVQYMITVSFNQYLYPCPCRVSHELANLCLASWVKMYLWVLYQNNITLLR